MNERDLKLYSYLKGKGGEGTSTPLKIDAKISNSLVISEGRYLSNLSSSYYYTPLTPEGELPIYDLNKPMKIHMRVKCTSQNSAAQAIVAGESSVYGKPRIEICGTQYNDILMTAGWSTDGSTWDTWIEIIKNQVPYSANSWYDIDYIWDGTTFSFIVTDGVNTASGQSTKGKFYSSSENIIFGKSNSGSAPATKIIYDLANCYYEENGIILWGNKVS